MPRQIEFYRDVLERFERTPGVKAAAVVNNLPLSGSSTSTVYKDVDGSIFPVMTRTISPNYFAVMGTPLIKGRSFTDADHADSPRVAIINEYLAHHLFPGRDPVGLFLPDEEGSNEVKVVGVVKNSWQLSYSEPAKGEVFRPVSSVHVRNVSGGHRREDIRRTAGSGRHASQTGVGRGCVGTRN
jgi:putative ABC transport system permease protein